MVAIHAPQLFLNKYLQEKIGQQYEMTIPFLPSMPSDIDALTSSYPESNGMLAVYDRMFKMRRGPFPHIKCEQILYYFYASENIEPLYRTQQLTQDLLDRGDESAQELNSWIYDTWKEAGSPTDPVGGNEAYNLGTAQNPDWFLLPYFHEIKIFQLEETRDIIDFGTARTWAGNKIIIDYEWHAS